MMNVRTRFAPSPTGFIHLGGMQGGFLNWLYTRQHQGKLVLRIEDIDQTRSRKEYAQALMEDLDWLDWIGISGPGNYAYGSTVQSEPVCPCIADAWRNGSRREESIHAIAPVPGFRFRRHHIVGETASVRWTLAGT